MTEAARLPANWDGPRYERIRELDGEPRFPDPYMDVYLGLVEEMESDMAVLPGMGALARILIRKVARDHVAALMADRQDSVMVTIKCEQGHEAFVPLWPENNARLIRSASELLKQARSADLGHALRTEFVLGLVAETMSVIDREMEDVEERVALKEALRSTYKSYLEGVQEKRKIS